MTGIAAIFMGFSSSSVRGRRSDVTIETESTRLPHVMRTGMRGEIVAMAGLAIATAIVAGCAAGWHVDGGPIGYFQRGIGVMTGGATIMNLSIQRINRHASR